MSVDQIEVNPIGLALVVPTYQIQKFGVPPSGVLWHPIRVRWHASHLIGIHKVLEDMHTDMAHVGMGVEVFV
jgi:hypothetical protein